MAKNPSSTEKWKQQWAKVIAKAWSNPRFKEKLLTHPAQALKEEGIEVPSGVTITIHENHAKTVHLVLPQKPAGALSEEELKNIAAAGSPAPCGAG